MAKIALALAALALLTVGALAVGERPSQRWACRRPSILFRARLAGATNGRGRQFPVGTFDICLVDGKKGLNPKINIRQNIVRVNNYNGFKLDVATSSFEDFGLDAANATNNTNTTGVPIIQCDPATNTITKCVAESVSMAGFTTTPLQREDDAANQALIAFINLGLCNPAPNAGTRGGPPRTARAATIAILANGDLTKGYTPSFFTAPVRSACTL